MFMIIISTQDSRDSRLKAENDLLRKRQFSMEAMRAATEPLTLEGVSKAVSYNGFAPTCYSRAEGSMVSFMISDQTYYIDLRSLPRVTLFKSYVIDKNEIDINLFRHAAHLMSDSW